jgi:hypothetical protein
MKRPFRHDCSMAAPDTSIVIATPCLDGNVNAHYAGALVKTMALLNQRGIRCEIQFEIGNSLIADARNKLVAKFLAGSGTDLVFIDADLSWQAEDLARLVACPHPVVAGVYQRKSRSKIDFTVKFGPSIAMDADRLMEVERVGTGFLRLRRDCLLALIAANPGLKLKNPAQPGDPNFYALFDTTIVDGQYIGEDFSFCDRWRALGGKVLIDPSIALAHHGAAAYDEPLMKYLQKN